MKLRSGVLWGAMAALSASGAYAADDIRWNGYLNVVGGILKDQPRNDSSGEEQYPEYLTYEDTLTFDPQTSGALQATKALDEKTSVTAQIYGEGSTESYKASLKWLYLTYSPTESSSFRIGRLGTPIYYYTDFFNVGFAYHWVSPPNELYRYDTTMTGIDYIYRGYAGSLEWSAEVYTGSSDQELAAIGGNSSTRDMYGTAFTVTHDGWLTGRLSLVSSEVTISVDRLDPATVLDSALAEVQQQYNLPDDTIDGFRQANIAPLSEKLNLEGQKATYADLFIKAEYENWLLMAERGRSEIDEYLGGEVNSWFVSGGYRMDDVLFHVTFSDVDTKMNDAALADRYASRADLAAQIGLGVATAFARERNAVTAGVRIDTSLNTALKFEITEFENTESLPGEDGGIGKNLLFRSALNVSF